MLFVYNYFMKKALFPGSFDPLHEGHISVYNKAKKLFDEVIFYVTFNPDKNNIQSLEKRAQNIKEKLPEAKVLVDKKMTYEIAKQNGCDFLVRGIRNNVDIEHEINLAAGNKKLDANLETVLILADEQLKTLSSRAQKIIDDSKKIAGSK